MLGLRNLPNVQLDSIHHYESPVIIAAGALFERETQLSFLREADGG